MTVRIPLKLDGSDFKEMTIAEIEAIRTEAIRQYGINPSVTLSVVTTGGNLGTISDTRLIAGESTTDSSDFDSDVVTPDVSTITVNYSKIHQSYDSSVVPWVDSSYSYPLYYDGNDLREMTETDFFDTFIGPAIDTITSATSYSQTTSPGTYLIASATLIASPPSTEVSGSATPIFTDTQADASLYIDSDIPNILDQPTDIRNYYLHRINPVNASAGYELPICYTKSDINLHETPAATFETALQDMIRYYAAQVPGTKISYNINGAGVTRGVMTDTRLDSSDYLTNLVDEDDYRTQEVPAGVSENISTYIFRINQV